MLITLEASDIATILQDAIRQQYRTPNVSITDKTLKKMQKLKVELQVMPVAARTQNMGDILGDERMRELANRMQAQGDEVELSGPSLDGGGL